MGMKPRLFIEQKITAFTNQYAVYMADEQGNKGQLLAFAQQKRLAFKEQVSFYTDESKKQLAFTMRAEKVMDIHGKFFVEDPDGKLIGAFKKDFTQSLINSTWLILDNNDATKLAISESNMFLAVIRRFGGFIPIIGELIDLIVLFFRYHFTFANTAGKEVGRYQKTTLFRDHYTLSLDDQAYATEDPRFLAAFAVALDALQSR